MDVRALSKYIPKFFYQSAQTTSALLKAIFRWNDLYKILENITSLACLLNQDGKKFSIYNPINPIWTGGDHILHPIYFC